MREIKPRSAVRGFTVIEMVTVIALVVLLVTLAVPPLQQFIVRSRLEGYARQTAMLMSRARIESVKMQAPAVIRTDYTNKEVVAFIDLTDAGGAAASDLLFNPVNGALDGTTDYVVGRLPLPGRVAFWGAGDAAPEGAEAVSQLTVAADGGPNIAVFEPDGTIRDRGAFRFGDTHGNYLEVAVDSEASGQIEIRKHNPDLAPRPDGSTYFPLERNPDTGKMTWEWY